ncbi:MAG: isopentenyl phosphate kinase [Patescibacteria group bacterium]|jgi:isopentenyl phosphate kinase
MKKNLTLIKLGGSIITDKEIPMSLRKATLRRLIGEIASAKQEKPEQMLIVGHGQGSFAHVPASKYQTMDGFINEESVLGMAIVQDSAATLNRLVVHEFIKHELAAVSFYASNTIVTNKRKELFFCADVVKEYLEKGLLPVTCGDVLVDRKQGCTIWSTEKILAFLADYFLKQKIEINKIIHVTEVAGFLDKQGQVVPEITAETWPEISQDLRHTRGFDVTGGMGLKIEESLTLAKKGIKSVIISGILKNNLYWALTGQDCVGTTIR